MPVKPFADIFQQWPDNDKLCIKDLRLKAVTLMALTLMLRPSDIVPKAVNLNNQTHMQTNWLFTTDNVRFHDSGCAKVVFHGIKSDTNRSGFEVQMQPTDNPKLNPVHALKVYIDRTAKLRPVEKPVFLSLVPPYGPISASTVASILCDAIKLAGLSNQGFSAKSFRPTGATIAIETGCDPEITMRQGRWKTGLIEIVVCQS